MYGTIAKIRVKPGMEERLMEVGRQESDLDTPGSIGYFVYRMDHDPSEHYLVVLFEDKKSYFDNANSPEQDARYREMLQFLDGEPEWHDGEIVGSFVKSGTLTSGMPMSRRAG